MNCASPSSGSVTKFHEAPWSRLLILISSLVTALCAGIAIGFIGSGREALAWVAALPMAIIAGSALFMIRGYSVTAGTLLIHRPFWTTRVPLDGLQSVLFEPDAMRGSIRLLGNGGLFSFTGLFRNNTLGCYHGFATDLRRTVVLRFHSRTVVVSPAAPGTFARDIAVSSHASRHDAPASTGEPSRYPPEPLGVTDPGRSASGLHTP